ncbi:hypothetical protein BJAS_P4258 [Bathymodiolus japonicus methanotrophic gill symbiont]|uniref:MobV family relaxase n=1 Tax=Bathymodiolus japonicus methanotrophic gill symbiont TaxID=113269 RepID=UPI001B41BAA9|nr:MobV family relaxase [Bathymodiolus japonicus methanotrophic gill symbiont]GFO73446.1 hypothetical protein BJAS_P4258 [Bathymodiolus japonicus methanotrophic gill symbiont]
MAYAIMRNEKLKTFGNIGGVGSHHFRTRETKNADSEKTPDNIRLIECKNDDLVEAVKNRIGDIKIRKNGVLAVEVLMTASPDFFRGDVSSHGEYNKQKVDDFNRRGIDYLKAEYGADNVVSAICHLDEATPHIQAVIVPIDYEKNKKGKLNAAKWLDGRKLLSEMQDRYFETMKSLGLERGIKGSESTHTTIKEFYGSLESSEILTVPEASIPSPPVLIKDKKRKEWANDESERINDFQKPTYQPIQSKAATSAIATKKAKQAEATTKKYAEELERMKKEANLVRDTDLAEIMERSNAKRLKGRGNVWEYNGEQIALNNSKFFNHYQNFGGGGAIDLVMHLQGFDFSQAVRWLGDEVGNNAAIGSAMTHAKKEAEKATKAHAPLPDPIDQHWPHVRDYLIEKRGLDKKYIDFLHDKDRIFSDFMKNACFRYGSKGVEKSGTRGIKWKGFNGVKDDGFKLTKKNPDGVVFVESGIDAISFIQLLETIPEYAEYKNFDIIAVGGVSSRVVFNLSKKYDRVVIGFDNDKNMRGDKSFDDIQGYIKNKEVERLTPAPLNDWNEYIKPKPDESAGSLGETQEINPIDNQ